MQAVLLDGDGRHRGIVCAQVHGRNEELASLLLHHVQERCSKCLICRHASSDRQSSQARFLHGLASLADENFNCSRLKAGGNVCSIDIGWLELAVWKPAHRVEDRRLESAKAKIQPWFVKKRSRK